MYCKISIVVMNHLSKEQRLKLIDLCSKMPDGFISISKGDESCPRELDFEDVIESSEGLSALAGDYTYIVTDGDDPVLEEVMMTRQKGYFAGEVTYII